HLLLCIADHYEPNAGKVAPEVAQARVAHWVREYPRRLGHFRDSDGRPPRHTFFYPIEDYHPDHLDALALLCRDGFGEVEIHLHHDNDTAEHLADLLNRSKELFAERHGLLARHRETGEPAYGFIHGNWALCNNDPNGRNCGVNNELDILRQTGCYADFTMPSAPHPTQTWKINSIYYASDRPGHPWSHNTGIDAGNRPPPNSLLLIQGPLVFDWKHAKRGFVPRLENGCLQGSQPPHIERVENWLRARVQVPGRPDWFFVKLHAHGAIESSHEALLGDPAVRFHEALARRAAEEPRFHYHYVTAREMYNLVKAAEAGWKGSVADARDFVLLANRPSPAEPFSVVAPDVLPASAAVPR
ncbi:MAG TPA: hypothetical protein VEL76_39385, partial [Gemmataceae bacterium]|nr:hypothetical protein [Gemmataceae bacterium]